MSFGPVIELATDVFHKQTVKWEIRDYAELRNTQVLPVLNSTTSKLSVRSKAFDICFPRSRSLFTSKWILELHGPYSLNIRNTFLSDKKEMICMTKVWVIRPNAPMLKIGEITIEKSKESHCFNLPPIGFKTYFNAVRKSNSQVVTPAQIQITDKLTIQCEICLAYKNPDDNIKPDITKCTSGSTSKIFNYYASLYNNEKFSDVILIVGGTKIFAHKLVLSSRSEYFATMFNSDFKESKDKMVTINEGENFKLMLKILYTNDMSEINFDEALNLIVLCQKYLINDLMEPCEEVISSKLNVSNYMNVLHVADSIQSTKLKGKVVHFIAENAKFIMNSPNWAKF